MVEMQTLSRADESTSDTEPRLVIAISSRALFDLNESNQIYEQQGVEPYRAYQIAHEDQTLEPGDAFQLVRKLLHINQLLEYKRVEVVLLSRNTADTGLRIMNSIKAHALGIDRCVFCGGSSPHRYAAAFGCHLFLSIHDEDVELALRSGLAAARLLRSKSSDSTNAQLRIAFDGDSVLFSDDAERVHRQDGLDEFLRKEEQQAHQPLSGGPFKPFLTELHALQQEFEQRGDVAAPIRTALVTARSAPAHERVVRTLRAWRIRLDEALFLGGKDKGPFLEAFAADVYFDDHPEVCHEASKHVATGHVRHGVNNEG